MRIARRSSAKFEKLGETDIDGQKYPAAELSVGGSSKSIPLVGKTQGKKLVADPRLVSAVKQIKPGTDVMIRTRDEGGKTWLRDIQRAPKQADSTGGKPKFDVPTTGTPKPDAPAKGK